MPPTKTMHRRMIPESFVHLLYDYLEACGQDAGAILQSGRPEAKTDSPANFPIERWVAMLELAATHLNDPLLGLKLGQTISPKHVGVLGYVLIASRNLEEALQRLDRFQRLIYDVTPMERRSGDGYVDLVWTSEHGSPGPLADETAIAALVQFCRNMTNHRLTPHFVHFTNPRPEDLAAYTGYFGCPVRFDQEETIVRIDQGDLKRPLHSADPGVIELMERHAENLLSNLRHEDALIEGVRNAIAACLHDGEPSIDTVATLTGRTRRALQRDLTSAGTSFREEVNALRKELAMVYLRNAHLSMLDIAMLLGYSEQSAFSRNFRQWMGVLPEAYREAIRTPAI